MREARVPFASASDTSRSSVTKNEVDDAAHEAAASPYNARRTPTRLQAHAGNYKKGRINIAGLRISIENPAGSHRRPEWPALASHYGYVRGSRGADGDHVDVFVRPGTAPDFQGPVYVVDQLTQTGEFDEHKVMLGWSSREAAEAAYLENYSPGWKVGPITEFSMDEFKQWLKGGTTEAVAKAERHSETPIKRAVMPHVPQLKTDIQKALNTISKDIGKRMNAVLNVKKSWDVKSALENEFNVRVTDKTEGRISLQPILEALHELMAELCEESPLLAQVLVGHYLMDVVVYPDATITSGCYAGGMADYEGDEATLYVAGGRPLAREPLMLGCGKHNVATDLRTVMTHELGHLVMQSIEEVYGKKFKILYDEKPREWWSSKVSKYCETSDHECFAECFAAYTHPQYVGGLPVLFTEMMQAVGINPKLLRKAKKRSDLDRMLDTVGDADWTIFEGVMSDPIRDAFARAGYEESASLQLGIDMDLIDQAASTYAEEHGADLVTQISDSTREMLRGTVQDAIDEGWSREELADRIEDAFGFSEYRSGMIAQTELALAHSQGRIEASKEGGAIGKQALLSADHDDTADCCCTEAAEAGVVPIDEDFTDDEDSDFPPFHPNCWCDWVAVYPGDEGAEDLDDEEDDSEDDE